MTGKKGRNLKLKIDNRSNEKILPKEVLEKVSV